MKHSSKSSTSKYRSKANSRDRVKHKNIQRNRSEHQSKDTLGEFSFFGRSKNFRAARSYPILLPDLFHKQDRDCSGLF